MNNKIGGEITSKYLEYLSNITYQKHKSVLYNKKWGKRSKNLKKIINDTNSLKPENIKKAKIIITNIKNDIDKNRRNNSFVKMFKTKKEKQIVELLKIIMSKLEKLNNKNRNKIMENISGIVSKKRISKKKMKEIKKKIIEVKTNIKTNTRTNIGINTGTNIRTDSVLRILIL